MRLNICFKLQNDAPRIRVGTGVCTQSQIGIMDNNCFQLEQPNIRSPSDLINASDYADDAEKTRFVSHDRRGRGVGEKGRERNRANKKNIYKKNVKKCEDAVGGIFPETMIIMIPSLGVSGLR